MSNHKANVSENNSKIVKAGAAYVIGNYLLKGITFLSAPIFTRLLSTSDYGEFSTYYSYEAIVYILVGLALHSSINNAKYKYGERLDEYVSSIIALIMLSTGAWLIFANVGYGFYGEAFGFSRAVANLLIIHCMCSSFMQVYNVYISLNYSVGMFLKVSAFNGIFNIIVSVMLILTVFSDQRSLGRIVGTVVPIVLIGIYIVVFFFKKVAPSFNREFWKFGLVYSIPIIPHGIAQVVLSIFDRIMIRDMVGAAANGIYSFAYTIHALFNVVATSLDKVWKPWLYEKMEAKEYEEIRRQGTKYAFGMALYTVMIVLAAPEIIKVLGDKEYWGATPCVIPVVLGGYFTFLYTLPSLVEFFYGKTKLIAVGTMGAAVINVVTNYIFIQAYGYIAAAYTTLITYILCFVFHYLMAKKVHGNVIYDTKKLLLISSVTLAIGLITIFLEKYWLIRWLLLIVVGLYTIYWGDKQFGVVKKVKAKMSRI